MRKLLLFLVILISLVSFGILILNNRSTTPQKSNAEVISPSPSQSNSIEINGLTFTWVEINNLENLKLIPNFTEKLSAKEVIQKNNCKVLVNAGFYATQDNIPGDNFPIGLFISDGKTLSNWQNNSLFDGILSINYLLTPRITRNIPQDELKHGVQTGPIIKENGSFINLKIMNDTEDRRMLAAITGENKLYFLTIYDKDSEYSGPLLANVPTLLENFEDESGITFADAINLDGGSASVFYTSNNDLYEISNVGAFFCET